MARPKVYTGSTIGVKLSSTLDNKIRGEAEKTGRSISEIVRSTLERQHGGANEAADSKN